jgi:hypothetical protein
MDPWEGSAEGALRWSFGMLARELSVPSIFGSLLSPSRGKSDLTKLDLRAQAALIRAEVDRMGDPVSKCFLVAYYLPKPVAERKAGGGLELVDRFGEERRAAVHGVAWWLMGQAGTGVHRIRGYREVVTQFCLGRPSSRRLREMFKLDANRVREKRDDCHKKLEELRVRSLAQFDARLCQRGILAGSREEHYDRHG